MKLHFVTRIKAIFVLRSIALSLSLSLVDGR